MHAGFNSSSCQIKFCTLYTRFFSVSSGTIYKTIIMFSACDESALGDIGCWRGWLWSSTGWMKMENAIFDVAHTTHRPDDRHDVRDKEKGTKALCESKRQGHIGKRGVFCGAKSRKLPPSFEGS